MKNVIFLLSLLSITILASGCTGSFQNLPSDDTGFIDQDTGDDISGTDDDTSGDSASDDSAFTDDTNTTDDSSFAPNSDETAPIDDIQADISVGDGNDEEISDENDVTENDLEEDNGDDSNNDVIEEEEEVEPVSITYYIDADSDGYGDVTVPQDAFEQPVGYVEDSTDCNDADATINPGALEDVKDDIDQDCTGVAKTILSQDSQFFAEDDVTPKATGPVRVITINDPVTNDSRSMTKFNVGNNCSRTLRDDDDVVTHQLKDDGACDGTFATGIVINSVFDITGELVQSRTTITFEDQDADGDFTDEIGSGLQTVDNYLFAYTFQADGVTPATRTSTLNGLDHAYVVYNENGEVISADQDEENDSTGLIYDGVYDSHTESGRDANGFLVSLEVTDIALAYVSQSSTYVNDAFGVRTFEVRVKTDEFGTSDTTHIVTVTTYSE